MITMSETRVRFAPSPTGFLHVGGARTALFNWLYARKTGGKFLLRIEDSDKERSSAAHVEIIIHGLSWFGLDYDEEIVYQADGLERHRATGDRLLASGHAYEDDGAVRFRVPQEEIAWDDIVHGRTAFSGADIKDFVILRSDRTPTYNFVVVCDDIEMGITHVIRGDDHVSNTPKQITVYQALGADIPTFAHVPMIHGTDGRKLSKRHGATAIGDYEAEGILPGAMRNFLALLGWNPKDERELFFEMGELVDAFSLEAVQKKAAIFDPQKLEWMNGQYITNSSTEYLLSLTRDEMSAAGVEVDSIDRARLDRTIAAVGERARTTHQLAQRVALRLTARDVEFDEKARKQRDKDPEAFRNALQEALGMLDALGDDQWNSATIGEKFKSLAEASGAKLGRLMQPVRIAVTGTTVSETVTELLPIVGRDESLRRIRAALS